MMDPQQPGTMNQAQDATSQIADQARQKSGEVMQQAQETAKNTLDQQKGRAAQSVGTVADALRHTGEHLQQNDQGSFGQVANQLADRLEQFSNDLQNKSVDEMIDGVENFARQDPQLFLGGAVVLGLLAARFLKASGERRNQRYYGGQGRYGSGNYRGQGQYGGQYGQRYYDQGATRASTPASRGYTQQDLADYRRQTLRDQQAGQYRSGYSVSETGPAGTGYDPYETGDSRRQDFSTSNPDTRSFSERNQDTGSHSPFSGSDTPRTNE